MGSLCTIRCLYGGMGLLSVLFLLITSLPHLHALNNCSKLVAQDGNAENVFLPCTEYGTDACERGVGGGFPANLSTGESAPIPRNLQVSQFVGQTIMNGNYSLVTGLRVSWTEPEPGFNRSFLKGYYLKIERVGSGRKDCRLFDLQNANAIDKNGSLTFSYTMLSPEFNDNHMVTLCSLSVSYVQAEFQNYCPSESIAFTTPDPHYTFPTSTKTSTSSLAPSPASTEHNTELTQSSTSAVTPTSTAKNNDNTTTEMPPTAYYSTGGRRSSATDVGVIVAAVVGSVVLVVGVLVVGCLWKHRRSVLQTCLKLEHKEDAITPPYPEITPQDDIFPAPPSHQHALTVPEISRKSVLLLASEDHKYFSQALHSFAAFLSLHCQCDVMFAPQQLSDVRRENSYVWLSGRIDQADVVVIVTSEAACRLYRAFQNGQLYKEADLGPEGDLFTPGIKHICGKIANGEDVSKVMMVRFDHTCTSQCLPVSALPPSLYPLPARLRSFLLHLHGLDDNTMDLSRANLPLQGNVEELEGGKEWLDAVQDSISFEREHPQWFEEMFGTPVSRNNVGRPAHASPVHAQNSEELNPLQRRLSSVSTHANKDHYRCQTTSQDLGENPSVFHTESEFLPPSVFDANSAHTVPFSDFTVSEPPLEIDEGVSHLLRMVNAQYEQEQLKEGRGREQWEGHGSDSSNEQDSVQDEHTTRSWKVPSTVPGCNNVEVQFYDENYDCISVSSAQSV